MQVIYNVVTATNESYGKKYNIESVIPYLPRTTFIVRGDNEIQCFNKICNYFRTLYFHFDGEIETCIRGTNDISFILSKWVGDEHYCRAINVYAIRTIKDEIHYLWHGANRVSGVNKKGSGKMITIRSSNYTLVEKQILADGLKNFFLIGTCADNKCSNCEIRTLCSDIKSAHAHALKLIEKEEQNG